MPRHPPTDETRGPAAAGRCGPGAGASGASFRRRVAASLTWAALLAGCQPPDRPPHLADPLPGEFHVRWAPDTIRTVRLADGVWYRYVWSPRGPWAIHLVEADLRRCELGLQVVRAPEEEGKRGGHARVTELVEADTTDGALVALNGDFFTPEGTPLGPEIGPDGVRTLRSRPVLAWQPGRKPWIGPAQVEGGGLVLEGWRPAEGAPGVAVVGGYPELLDRGRRVGDLLVSENPNFAGTRHPRTAVGVEPARDVLWLVVVDGRQAGYSLGMTLPELANLFEALGVPEALNLDGGGSSVMVVRGRAASRPSDEAGERPVVNALVLRDDPAFCLREGESGTSRPG